MTYHLRRDAETGPTWLLATAYNAHTRMITGLWTMQQSRAMRLSGDDVEYITTNLDGGNAGVVLERVADE